MDYNYDINDFNLGTGSESLPAEFWAVFAGLMGVVVLIAIICAVVMIIAQWKMFKKGNQPGWAAIIPIYNQYVQCKMVGVNPWWILICFVAGLFGFIPVLGNILSLVVSIYFAILLNVSTARSFGKEDSFAIGLVLLPIIFYPILGFGKSEYKGADNSMNDFVFKKGEEIVKNGNNANKKFCPYCGAKMNNDSKFCPSCGKEVE